MSRGRLVFDGHCGFCTRSVGWVRRLDRHGRVECVPLQSPGAPDSVGASEQECHAAVQWRGADGRRCSGAEAVNAALSAALGTKLPLAVYAATRPLQDWAYAWIAVNRYRFRGATPHCSAHPGDCASSRRQGCRNASPRRGTGGNLAAARQPATPPANPPHQPPALGRTHYVFSPEGCS